MNAGRRASCPPWLRGVSWAAAIAIWTALAVVVAVFWPSKHNPNQHGDADKAAKLANERPKPRPTDRLESAAVPAKTESQEAGRIDGPMSPIESSTVYGRNHQPTRDPMTESQSKDDPYRAVRRLMVDRQLRSRDITDPRVLAAMEKVPRHLFVPDEMKSSAYADRALPIEFGQTISQPYIVALMTQWAAVSPNSKVLEIGTGSGYQAAVLAEICKQVFTIEIVEPLAVTAQQRLSELGYQNVIVRCGDGYLGWPEEAPFDAIVVTAAPDHVPQPLIDQLALGGRMVIPVGRNIQELLVIEKEAEGRLRRFNVASVLFVPMTGRAEQGAADD